MASQFVMFGPVESFKNAEYSVFNIDKPYIRLPVPTEILTDTPECSIKKKKVLCRCKIILLHRKFYGRCEDRQHDVNESSILNSRYSAIAVETRIRRRTSLHAHSVMKCQWNVKKYVDYSLGDNTIS